ncbi:Tn3 transposase DDE domain protein [Legionella santicrucis]|uniref:Tn3 transposase DDE domain protein n=1 Tax=Legionella santicrucis TaxID=45074 RepID=A0A0W0YRW8_9GAMM|nr:Tn3 transposase DDE domain protein [Legionella santicrucis]
MSDQFSGFHSIVVPETLRDSISILEGLLEQQMGLNPTEIMADAAGVRDMVFGLFWLLGYQFSPRLADAGPGSSTSGRDCNLFLKSIKAFEETGP